MIEEQLRGALDGVDSTEFQNAVVAYEPVWAIGTGQVCGADEAERVCAMMRKVLEAIYGADAANSIRILYGGSVKPANARELFHKPNIDGGLIGGASLDAHEFSQVVKGAL